MNGLDLDAIARVLVVPATIGESWMIAHLDRLRTRRKVAGLLLADYHDLHVQRLA